LLPHSLIHTVGYYCICQPRKVSKDIVKIVRVTTVALSQLCYV